METNLGYLGDAGEFPIVKALIENRDFFLKMQNSVNAKSFTNTYLSKLINLFLTKYKDSGEILNYKSLEIIIKALQPSDADLKGYKDTFDRLKNGVTDEELKTGMAVAEEFFKRQECLHILELFKNNISKGYSTDKLGKYISDLQGLEILNDQDRAVNVDEMMEITLTTPSTERIPTLINGLDDRLRGGFAKGTVNLLIAGTGVGKSTLGTIICSNAASMGKRVLHIFFEDLKTEIAQKYYAHLTGKYTYEFENYLNDDEKRKYIISELKKVSNHNNRNFLKENIRLRRMKNGETTVEDIAAEVRKLEVLEGFKPEFIFIDYLSCLRTSSNEVIRLQNEYQAMERCMKKIEAYANTENIAILVAQQTNRNGMKSDTASDRMANVQGSFRVTQPASIILYLDRTDCEKNRANLYIDKARGCDVNGKTEFENILLDNGTCQIDLSDNSTELPDFMKENDKLIEQKKYELENNSKLS